MLGAVSIKLGVGRKKISLGKRVADFVDDLALGEGSEQEQNYR